MIHVYTCLLMHTLAELFMCVNGGVEMLNPIQSQTPRKSLSYITAATLNKINLLT